MYFTIELWIWIHDIARSRSYARHRVAATLSFVHIFTIALRVCKNACVIDQLTRSAFYLILAASVKLLTSCFLQLAYLGPVRKSVNQVTRRRSISAFVCATQLTILHSNHNTHLFPKVIWANHLLANRELKIWNNSSRQQAKTRSEILGRKQCATSWIYLLTVSIFRSIVSTLINCCKMLFAPQIFEH